MLWFFSCAWFMIMFCCCFVVASFREAQSKGVKGKKMKSKTGLHMVSNLFLNLKTFFGKTCMVCDEVSPFFPSQVDYFHCSPKDDVLRKPWHVVFPKKMNISETSPGFMGWNEAYWNPGYFSPWTRFPRKLQHTRSTHTENQSPFSELWIQNPGFKKPVGKGFFQFDVGVSKN